MNCICTMKTASSGPHAERYGKKDPRVPVVVHVCVFTTNSASHSDAGRSQPTVYEVHRRRVDAGRPTAGRGGEFRRNWDITWTLAEAAHCDGELSRRFDDFYIASGPGPGS
jgi:hypothetical protein